MSAGTSADDFFCVVPGPPGGGDEAASGANELAVCAGGMAWVSCA